MEGQTEQLIEISLNFKKEHKTAAETEVPITLCVESLILYLEFANSAKKN